MSGMAFVDWPSWWPFLTIAAWPVSVLGDSFEDLFRKFLGNNMAVFFAKDVLTIVLYISFFAPGAIVW